jgi:hypothetical protein
LQFSICNSPPPINPIDQPKKKRYYNGIYLGNTSFAAMTINALTQ